MRFNKEGLVLSKREWEFVQLGWSYFGLIFLYFVFALDLGLL